MLYTGGFMMTEGYAMGRGVGEGTELTSSFHELCKANEAKEENSC